MMNRMLGRRSAPKQRGSNENQSAEQMRGNSRFIARHCAGMSPWGNRKNPKTEIRNPKEGRNPKSELQVESLEQMVNWSAGRNHSAVILLPTIPAFGFRISRRHRASVFDFSLPCASFKHGEKEAITDRGS